MDYEPLLTGLSGVLYGNDSSTVLMQFTGLLDKNGKEIYEEDILKWNDHLLEVKWGQVGWVLFGKLFSRFATPNGSDCNEVNTKGYTHASEVIGNIYETPTLTKET